MATRLELIDKQEQLELRLQNLIDQAEKEQRKLDAAEKADYDQLINEINEVRKELETKPEFKQITNLNTNTTMEKRNFSILKAINEQINGNVSEETRSVIEAGKKEMQEAGQTPKGTLVIPVSEVRAAIQVSGSEEAGGVVKTVDKVNILAPLRDKLVAVQAGATYLTGLVGDVAIPAYSGSNVGWASEIATAKDGAGQFSEVVLSPKRLTAILDVSNQFLSQDSVGAEEMLRADLVRAVAEKLEQTIFGAHETATDKPDGFFTTLPTDKGALTFSRIVEMEASADSKNVSGNMSYIMNPKLKAKCKTTTKATTGNVGFIWEDNGVNGYPVYSSNAVAGKIQSTSDEYGIIFGNFNDYVIGQWGSLDITVDRFTKAADGQTRLVVNAYFDAKPRRKDSFVVATMK